MIEDDNFNRYLHLNVPVQSQSYLKKRDAKFSTTEEVKSRKTRSKSERRGRVTIPAGFIGNGSKNGIKRIQCKACRVSLNIDKWV